MSILTQAQQSTTGVSNVVNNYSREDIGITLKVKPRLSSNNQVTLEVETVIEDIDPSSEQAADRPTTTKRKVMTSAIVQNGEMIILGGLIKNAGGKGVQKVPFLGDIPVLGEMFFTHTSDVNREANVVIYLTPYIVRKSGDLRKLRSMLSELEEVQGRYNTYMRDVLDAKKDGKPLTPKKSCKTTRGVQSSTSSSYNSSNTVSHRQLRGMNVEDF